MGFFDSISRGISNVVSGAKRIGEKVVGGVKRIGDVVNQGARFGQKVLSGAEQVGAQIGQMPIIGEAARRFYETSPLAQMHKTAKEQLDSVERISGNVGRGDFKGAVSEAMKNEYIKQHADKFTDRINAQLPGGAKPYFNMAKDELYKL